MFSDAATDTIDTPDTIAPASGIQLRDYQLEAIEAIRAATARGVKRFVVAIPTGGGKTLTFAAWSANRILETGGRVIALCHTDEIVEHTVAAYQRYAPGLDVGVVKGQRDECNAQVVVATVQTLSQAKRLARLQRTPAFRTIIVDEAHHSTANSYQKILAGLATTGTVVAGWTATPFRAKKSDNPKLVGPAGVFSEVVYQKPIIELIRAEHLSDVKAYRFRLDRLDLDAVKRVSGDYSDKSLDNAMRAAGAIPAVVGAYHQYLSGKSAIAFAPTVPMAYDVAAAFRAAGVTAATVEAETPIEKRRDILERLKTGRLQVVTNAKVLTEGFDAPVVSGILILRPTTSSVFMTQMIGRGLRPGKPFCTVLDFTGSTAKHDLAGFGAALGAAVRDGERLTTAVAREAREAAAAIENTRLVAEAVDLFRSSRTAWSVSDDKSVMTTWLRRTGGNLDVVPDATPDGTKWRVLLVPKHERWEARKHHRWVLPRDTKLVDGLSLSDARAFAEAYAVKHDGPPAAGDPNRLASPEHRKLYERVVGPAPERLTSAVAAREINTAFAVQRELARQNGKRMVV